MENLQRTSQYLDRVAGRLAGLRRFSAEILAGRKSLTLEIGSGHGHFLTAYAQAHPEKICLGLDIIAERVGRAIRKRDRAQLANLHFVHASVQDFLTVFPEDARLADIFVLFPDPWPKRRHHKNRIMQTPVLDSIAARSEPGGRLYFRTDDENYFAATHAVLKNSPHWSTIGALWPFEHETVFQQRAREYQSLVAEVRFP